MLKRAGLTNVTMGIQSGSERTRNAIYRRYTPTEVILKAMTIFKKHGIFATYDLILDNPLEDEDDLRATLELCLRIPRPFGLNLFSLVNFPKTALTGEFIRMGCIDGGKALKALNQWRMSIGAQRDNKSLYWNSLISLAGQNHFPRHVIVMLSRMKLIKGHPSVLIPICRASERAEYAIDTATLLAKGKIPLSSVLRRLRKVWKV